jgi:hypothetical protein
MDMKWWQVKLVGPDGDIRSFTMHGTYRQAVLEGLAHEGYPESEMALLCGVEALTDELTLEEPLSLPASDMRGFMVPGKVK